MPLPETVINSHRALGIPENYQATCNLPFCAEPKQLVATERDFYDRPQQLTPDSLAAWSQMKKAAAADGVSIFLISAYRSVQYQHDLLAKKLEKGASIEQVLRVNAAPGFSEHHTGRAVDIGTFGCDALVEKFEETDAFQWLNQHATAFGFAMSYPRDNPQGLIYEPWHWCFQGLSASIDPAQDQP